MAENVRLRMGEASIVPVWHWRGARPGILDLDEDQAGSVVCLLFVREGDCCLLPVAWRYEQAAESGDWLQPALPFAEEALDAEMMDLARRSLVADGWRVSGRLDLHFEGRWAASEFWRQVGAFLR